MGSGTDTEGAVIEWLLSGDPAIRWQVMRDLQARSETAWRPEQQRVATEGWGSRLLERQDESGRWTPRLYGYKWISTTYSMVLLKRMGLPAGDPRAVRSCRLFVEEGMRDDGGIDLSASLDRAEVCLTGMVLGLLAWFDVEHDAQSRLVEFLLRTQMADGGWNCERDRGAVHASLHTTISVLEGLREYATGEGPHARQTEAAEQRGRAFLLEHHLFRSHRSGEVIDDRMLRLSFPPRWRYDILRALDHFQSAGAAVDDRAAEAVDVLRRKRRSDGRWPLQQRHPGRTWFELEKVGEPSRWNTLRALRVLKWFECGER